MEPLPRGWFCSRLRSLDLTANRCSQDPTANQDSLVNNQPADDSESGAPMPIVDDVSAAIADAMRRQDRATLSALRMLKAAFMNRSVEKRRDLDDGEARQVVSSLVKQRKDAIEQFTKGNRQDLADKEAAEILVLEAYLPAAADPALVEQAVADAITETGAGSVKDMGRVMKAAMAKLADQNVDGKMVSELVRAKLGNT